MLDGLQVPGRTDSTKPRFRLPVARSFERYNSGEVCRLVSLDGGAAASEADLAAIAAACNQEAVYRFLFRESLKGRAYTEDDARAFVEWAEAGWREGSQFVFVVRDPGGNLVASMGIHSADLDEAEIGYWARSEVPGVMTNALACLCDVAREAGYRKLYALVEAVNVRSVALLERVGFGLVGQQTREISLLAGMTGKRKVFQRYEKPLGEG